MQYQPDAEAAFREQRGESDRMAGQFLEAEGGLEVEQEIAPVVRPRKPEIVSQQFSSTPQLASRKFSPVFLVKRVWQKFVNWQNGLHSIDVSTGLPYTILDITGDSEFRVVADNSGFYTFNLPIGCTYTITPRSPKGVRRIFTPPRLTVLIDRDETLEFPNLQADAYYTRRFSGSSYWDRKNRVVVHQS
jgi:hypothetical protein